MTILGDWFYYNEQLHASAEFNKLISESSNRLYEVLRVLNGSPLFLKDHFERFLHSEMEMKLQPTFNYKELNEVIREVISINNIDTCNLRFEVILKESKSAIAIYLLPFSYPSKEQYSKGVKLVTLQIERPDPHIKQSKVNNAIRNAIKEKIAQEDIFEVLLVDYQGNITEGSKSNVFFVKENCLYSPPSEKMLEGITRKKVIQIAKEKGIQLIEQEIVLADINWFEACFITGTSPKLLPVSSINTLRFNKDESIMRQLMDEYNILVQA
jgi:branched-chain amino acid aminotransferase